MKSEIDRMNPREAASYRRRLSLNHPLNRRQFLDDRVDDLRLIAIGVTGTAVGNIGSTAADGMIRENREQVCYQELRVNDCDPTALSTAAQWKLYEKDTIPRMLGGASVIGEIGGPTAIVYGVGRAAISWTLRRRRIAQFAAQGKNNG